MHILSDCLKSYQVAFALGKDSDLTQAFSAVIHRLKEAGFIGVSEYVQNKSMIAKP